MVLIIGINQNTLANDIEKWTFETGGRVIAKPVIRNDSLFIGSCDGNFYVIDVTNGQELWHYETGNEIRTTAALQGSLICIESGNVLYGLNTAGNILWTDTLFKGDLTNEHDKWDCFRSSPQINNNIAYIGSENGLVLGVNILTGDRVFEAQTPQADATIETTPAIYKNKIYVGDWLGVFSVFDLTTGDLVWQFDTKDDISYEWWVNAIISQPLIYRDTVYFGGRNCNLYAFNPETGEKIWRYKQPDDKWLFGGPVVSNDTLYVGSSYQKMLYAFSPDEPELFWEENVYGLNYGDPVIHDNLILVGTGGTSNPNSGSLTIVDKRNHKMIERFNVGGWVETPAYYKGTILFGCGDSTIYAIDEKALLENLRPDTYVKMTGDIDLGQQFPDGSIDTCFYIFNDGPGADSLSGVSSGSYVSVTPEKINLLPGDSAKVTISVQLSDLELGKDTISIQYNSLNSLIPDHHFLKDIFLDVVKVTGLNDHRDINVILEQNYPNPAHEVTHINFTLKKQGAIEIILNDLTGKEKAVLLNGVRKPGRHNLRFNTSQYENGIYFYALKTNNQMIKKKMIIIN